MADQSLINYIKQNLANGFSEGEIKQALRLAGWQEKDIVDSFAIAKNQLAPQALTGQLSKDKNFVSQNSKKIITALVVLVFFPILGIGGFFLYQNFGPSGNEINTPLSSGQVSGERTSGVEAGVVSAEELQKRDTQRLTDVSDIQQALEKYFERYQTYPQKLSDLINDGLLSQIPKDPKNDDPYLYTAFGQPALYYSLAWILESDVGTLAKGLHTASSENRIPVENFLTQQSVILGEEETSQALTITDLSVIPFYPQEEVTLEVNSPAENKLVSAILILENSYINLTDTKAPFVFRFSAPADSGQYTVNVYGFGEPGTSYFQQTTLTVK